MTADDAEVEANEGGRGERVGDAAFEDEIDVHQAVADDRPTEGEGYEDKRKTGELSDGVWGGDVREIRNDVEQGEGCDREQRAAGKPLQLLTL